MKQKYTVDELEKCSKHELMLIVISMQEQLEKMNENLENLVEQIRLSNHQRFGRQTEKLRAFEGQYSFFDEAEALSEDFTCEPAAEDVLRKKNRKKKEKGKRNIDLKDLPEENHDHDVSKEQLDAVYGKGNWRELPSEEYKRLRFEPASWTVENHKVHVYVGRDGDHQDEFLRGDRPRDLFRNSIVTPSLAAAILNAKYVTSMPLYRIEQEFERNGINISRQTMANWVIGCSTQYFAPLWERLKEKLLEYPVTQADETPVEVIQDGREAGSKSYMWVHRTGEFYTDQPLVLYEYQKTRSSEHPKDFYRGYKGVLMTDGLSQYHKICKELEGVTNANCWAHARRDYADAIKAMGKADDAAIKQSVAYQALARIASIYKQEEGLKSLSSEERLKARQSSIKPLVEEYFAWVKERLADTSCLPKGKTAAGLKYSVNQEQYLKVFLTNGDVPIDNSASERSIRTFCIGRNNWVLINSLKGARASAVIYSIAETAKLNHLNPYNYFRYLLEELPKLLNDDGTVDPHELDPLMPWSKNLPARCYKQRRE